MAMLFKEHEGFETYMNIDERSASFMALGIAKAHKEPTVLVCTSGSAVAHYLPAILEAQYTGVPLIVLSADRPHTLLHVGAPQTVDQHKIFGTAVNYFEELAVPQESHYYTYPRQVARKAYMKAMDTKKGPVHINVPLFEPLVPELSRNHFEAGRSSFKVVKPNYSDIFACGEGNNLLERYERILILAGPQIDVDEADMIRSFGEALQAPILADPLSNVRGCGTSKVVISTYDALLAGKALWHELKPDCVIQFGQIVVSKRVQQMIASWTDVEYIEVNSTMDSMNPTGKTTMHVQASIDVFTHVYGKNNNSDTYLNIWRRLDQAGKKQLSSTIDEPHCFEGRTIRELQKQIPEDGQIFVANSMTIRDFDYFWFSGESKAVLYGNRGVNGIDGTISTALGLAANGRPTYLVTGDLSLFHDLNGLAVAKTLEYLPQKGTKHFDYLFSTSQGLDYSGAAKLYGCGYTKISSPNELSFVLAKIGQESGVHIIEIPTNREYSRELHKKYTKVSVDMEALL